MKKKPVYKNLTAFGVLEDCRLTSLANIRVNEVSASKLKRRFDSFYRNIGKDVSVTVNEVHISIGKAC